jgi:hypothetical protein
MVMFIKSFVGPMFFFFYSYYCDRHTEKCGLFLSQI